MKLLNKTLIALSVISSSIGLTFLGAYLFSKKSEQLIGGINQTKLNLTDFFNKGQNFSAFVASKDPETLIATYDEKTGMVLQDDKELEFDVFFKQFIKDNEGQMPIMRVFKQGLNFYNEYLEAVNPKAFVDYINWFVENVAWGPEAISLKSFSIMRNISKSGSALLLGGHKTKKKEEKVISFFPDSFFGSLPLYDGSAGKSNARDRLLQPLNTKLISIKEVDQYLENINRFNILANDLKGKSGISFRNLTFAHFLVGKKIFYFVQPDGQTVFIDAPDKKIAFEKVVAFNQSKNKFKGRISQDFTLLDQATITEVKGEGTSLAIRFGENGNKKALIKPNDFSELTQFSLDQLEAVMLKSIISFRDIYNIGQYLNREYYVYKNDQEQFPKVYENILKAKEDLAAKYDSSKLKKLTLTKIKVENKNLQLEFSNNEKVVEKVEVSGDDTSYQAFAFMFLLKRAFGYKTSVSPYIVKAEGDNFDVKTGKTEKFYKIYNQIYQDLIETVLYKYPHLQRSLEGEHLERYVKEDGSYGYKMVNGPYLGLSTSDRIPFLMLLAATSSDFKGVGFDFLKYVGAHEYGHHTTLQNIQNLGDGKTPILLGSLSANSSPSEGQYYNAAVLRQYLEARTPSLDFKQGNINDYKTVGPYTFFKWKDSKNNKEFIENENDIWGSERKNITETLLNPRRRFVQDLEGIKAAAKARGMTLYELFLTNSLDTNSGTINPELESSSKFMDKDGNFVLPSYAKLFDALRDGQNNPIKFNSEPFITESGRRWPINPIVIEYESDGETVKEVKIFNDKGEPVINVLPGEVLNHQQKKLEESIKTNLLSLLYSTYFSAGWNKNTTDLSFDMNITVGYIDGASGPELIISNKNKSIPSFVDWIKKYFEQRDQEDGDKAESIWSRTTKGNINLYKNIIAKNNLPDDNPSTINLSTQLLYLLDKESPRLRLDEFVGRFDSNNQQYFTDISKTSVAKNRQVVFPRSFANGFLTRYPSSQEQVDKSPRSPFIFRLLDKRSRPIEKIVRENLNNSANILAIDPVKLESLDSPFSSSLFGAYLDKFIVPYQTNLDNIDGSAGKQKRQTIGFNNLEDLSEFSSIDLTKISIGTKNIDGQMRNYRVFDLEYVKSKFDLTKFITNYKAWVASIPKNNPKRIETLLKKVETEQDAANEIMERFLRSSVQFLIKNSLTTENLDNIAAALHEDLGIGQFRENNLVFKNEPNRENNEINAKDIYDTIQNFLKLNNIKPVNGTSNNNQLTTLDVLLMLGRIRFAAKIPDSESDYQTGYIYRTDILQPKMKKWGPSSDVINYINNRSENNLSSIFSDYTFTLSEVLTRDYVQITYSPSHQDLQNLPNYVKGATEANTGHEYFLSASSTEVWEQSKLNLKAILSNVSSVMTNYSTESFNRSNNKVREDIIDVNEEVIALRKEIRKIEESKLEFTTKLKKDNEDVISQYERSENLNRQFTTSISALTNQIKNFEYINVDGKRILRLANQIEKLLKENQDNVLLQINSEIANVEKTIKELNDDLKPQIEILNKKDASIVEIEEATKKMEQLRVRLLSETERLLSIASRKDLILITIKNTKARLEELQNTSEETVNKRIAEWKAQIVEIEQRKKQNDEKLKQLKTKVDAISKTATEKEAEFTEKSKVKNKELEILIGKLLKNIETTDKEEINSLASNKNLDSEIYVNSSFFGKVNLSNNGYFYDRWLRKSLDWEIYDDQGKSIEDPTIRLTDLNGDKITNRARAYWVYLLKSKGVSLGTLTGTWRDKERDANVFWGYVPRELGTKIKYLAFEDIVTKEIIYSKIYTDGTNNLFYLKKAGDSKTKVTLADEGYTSWVTNYEFSARYRNALLKPKHTYKVYFVDDSKNLVEGFTLRKDTETLAENNKTVVQSPTYFFKKDGNEKDVFYYVQDQFNI